MVGAHRREGQWAGGLPGHLLLRLTDTLEITGTLATITTTLPVTLTNLEQGGQMAVITSTETVTITGTISPTEAISGTGWVGPKGIASLLPPRWLMAPSGLNGGSDPGTSLVMDIDYTYDSLYRLTDALYNGGYYRFEFKYDAVGNRTQMVSQMPSGQMLTTNYSYDIANRLTSVDSITYTWDANGNLLHDGLSAYTYDQANRLTGISGALGTYGFAYNGLGDRMQSTVDGVTTSYSLDLAGGLTQVLADSNGNAYLYGLGRIGEEGAGWQYHHGDALGSVRQLTDSTGSITLSQSYRPFGEVLNSAGSGSSSYGFTGEMTDDTGLIYLRARYMDPGAGRFISRDSWGGDRQTPMSYNGWLYVYANPINLTDPLGNQPIGCNPGSRCSVTTQNHRDLTLWLYNELHTNSRSDYTLKIHSLMTKFIPLSAEKALSVYRGLMAWTYLVQDKAKWDFKHRIQEALESRSIVMFHGIARDDYSWYDYSVPGNIHFGYVGRAAGISSKLLHGGASVAEIIDPAHEERGESCCVIRDCANWFNPELCEWLDCFYINPDWGSTWFDDPMDFNAVEVGIKMYDTYGRFMSFQSFQKALKQFGHWLAPGPDIEEWEWINPEWPYRIEYFNGPREAEFEPQIQKLLFNE